MPAGWTFGRVSSVATSPDGQRLVTLGIKGRSGTDEQTFNRPADVAFAPSGDVYGADGYGNSRVVRFSKDGRYLGAWGRKGSGPSEFNTVHSVAVDSTGTVYVSDRENNRIQIFDAEGRFLRMWTHLGATQSLYITAFSPHRLLLTVVLLAGLWVVQYGAPRLAEWFDGAPGQVESVPTPETAGPESESDDAAIRKAFETRSSGIMVRAAGVVARVLSDDRDGARHQRFIVELSDGLSLLIAHNIDLAPRVPLDAGDRVEIRGQYEWNDQGGVVHWTHHDPQNEHEPGWILHAGRRYE